MQLTELTARLAVHPHCTVTECLGSESRCRSFAEMRGDIEQAVRQLRDGGIHPGMRIGILAKNCYRWIVYELAIFALRAVIVALIDEVVAAGLEAAAGKFGLHLIITDREVTNAPAWMVPIRAEHPVFSPRAQSAYAEDAEYKSSIWVFSTGSSGRNKAIQTCRAGVEQLVDNLPQAFELQSGDCFLVFLPMASFQQNFLIYGCLWNGINVVITEPSFLFQALRKHPPTILLAPPAFFETIAGRFRNLPPVKRALLKTLDACRKRLPLRRLRDAVTKVTSRQLQQALGGRVRLMITGMAPVHKATLQLFDQIGMPIYEVYGMTECGMIAWNTPAARRLGSVGKPLRDATIRIACDGEVLVTRAFQPTSGYLFEESSEEQLLTYLGAGTIATGDVGYFDRDGFLYLQGRKKNIIVTAGGLKLHPETVENRLNVSLDINQSVVFGRGAGLTAVVAARSDTPETHLRIQSFIQAVNRDLDPESRITRVVFSEPFTAENGMLTANLKLNRKAIEKRTESELTAGAA